MQKVERVEWTAFPPARRLVVDVLRRAEDLLTVAQVGAPHRAAHYKQDHSAGAAGVAVAWRVGIHEGRFFLMQDL